MKIKLLHPFNFIIYSGPKTDDTYYDPNDDTYRYGFSLDLTTEIYFYKYDWVSGLNLRILGFGFEINKCVI